MPLENLVMVSGDSICLDIEYVKNSISKLEFAESHGLLTILFINADQNIGR